MNVTESIRGHAERTPRAVAYQTVRGEALTYGQLDATINVVAHRLLALGLAPGQTAVVATERLGRLIAVTMALARLGVAHAPPSLPPRHADIVLAEPGFNTSGYARAVALDTLWPGFAPEGKTAAPVPLHDDGAAVMFLCPSSGTTGNPKFVPISHALAIARSDCRISARALVDGKGESASFRQACAVAPTTSYGFMSLLIALRRGGTVLEPCHDLKWLPTWLAQSHVRYLIASPIQLQRMMEVLPETRRANTLDGVEVGGGLLPAKLYELARQRLCPTIIINYGMAECGHVAGAHASALQERPGAVGFPYPDVEIRIVDDEGRPVPAGEEGLVSIRSPRAADRYLDNTEATEAVFHNGWVLPRDRGVVEPDGMLRLCGRNDDVINRGGIKIDPQSVEMAMMALADLREVAVFAVPAGTDEVNIYAAIVPVGALDVPAFHARCRERLGNQAPQFVMQLAGLPRNAAGKVLRRELVRIAQESTPA